jgi:hypothetical protein
MTASEILKKAGFPNTKAGRKAFHKKYPHPEDFMMAHNMSHDKMAVGGYYPDGGKVPAPAPVYNWGAPSTTPAPALPSANSYTAPVQNTQFANPYQTSVIGRSNDEDRRRAAYAKANNVYQSGEAPIEPTASPLDLGPAAMEGALATLPGLFKSVGQEALTHYGTSALHRKGGPVFPQIQSADGFFSMGFENVPAPYQGGSFQKGGNYPAASTTGVAPIAPVNYRSNGKFMGKYAPGQEWKYLGAQGDTLGARLKLGKTSVTGQPYWDIMTSPDPADASAFGTFNPYDSASYSREHFNGNPADEVRRLEKIAIQSGNRELGGDYVGFGEGHPFPYQPRMPKNGAEAYGRPTYGSKWIAQTGGAPNYMDTDIFSNKINAYTGQPTPNSGAGYQFPMAPNAPAPNTYNVPGPGGMYDATPRYSTPGQNEPHDIGMLGPKKMGGVPCYNCGGSKRKNGGSTETKYASILKLNPADPATRDNLVGDFNKRIQRASMEAQFAKLQEIEQDPTVAAYGGTPEMFPYAMPYEYKGGGWIQGAVNPAHKGYCTPMTKATCTPRRKAFAMTMKKHHGFHKKQEGGEQMNPETLKSIMAEYQQGVEDPEKIASDLGITTEEVTNYLQYAQQLAQQQPVKPESPSEDQGEGNVEETTAVSRYGGALPMAKDGWDFTPDYRSYAPADPRITGLRTALKAKNISGYNDKLSDEQVIELGVNNKMISKGDAENSTGYDPYQRGSYGNYMQPAGFSTGWPGGAYKVKNKFNFYGTGNPFTGDQRTQVANAAAQGVIDPNTAKALKDAGMWYKQDIKNDLWSRIGLANGPKRIHTEFGFGDQPMNIDVPKQGTIVGNKLRKMFGPKAKEEDTAYQGFNNPQASQPDSGNPAADALFARDQAMRNSPAWAPAQGVSNVPSNSGITDPNIIAQLNGMQTGVATPGMPQTGAPEKTYAELDAQYRKDKEAADALFKEHGVHFNKRGNLRNFLGVKYNQGGYVPMAQTGYEFQPTMGDPSQDPDSVWGSLDTFQPSPVGYDPSNGNYMQSFKPGSPGTGSSTALNNNQAVQAIGDNPNNQFNSGMTASSDAVRHKAGEADFWKDINRMGLGTNIASIRHNNRVGDQLAFNNRIENRTVAEKDRNRGIHYANATQLERPDQGNAGNYMTGKFGGSYQSGGAYMDEEGNSYTEEELQKLRDGGYDVEFI